MTHDRPRSSKPWATSDWAVPAVVALAVCFQVQTDLAIGENVIRVSAADLLSPLLAVFILIDFQRNGLSLPAWRVPRLWLWLGVLTAVMTAALIVGRVHTGAWIPWAVYNKYAGWFALVWYFVLGGWFAGRDDTKTVESFVGAFLIFCCVISLYSLLGYLAWFGARIDFPEGSDATRFLGIMKNPNAFGLLVAMALAIQMPYMASARIFSQRIHILIATVLLVALFFSFSRSAWIGVAAAGPVLFFLKSLDVRRFFAAFFVAAFACALIIFTVPTAIEFASKVLDFESKEIVGSKETSIINFEERFISVDDEGFKIRLRSTRRAFATWREHPLVGAGLGSVLWPQLQIIPVRGKVRPVIIHSTFLWWLTEFGLIGFSIFLGFFFVCTRNLVRKAVDKFQDRRSDARLLQMAALGAVAVFAGASLGMEAMYQRHFWFFLGWALALPLVGAGATAQSTSTS